MPGHHEIMIHNSEFCKRIIAKYRVLLRMQGFPALYWLCLLKRKCAYSYHIKGHRPGAQRPVKDIKKIRANFAIVFLTRRDRDAEFGYIKNNRQVWFLLSSQRLCGRLVHGILPCTCPGAVKSWLGGNKIVGPSGKLLQRETIMISQVERMDHGQKDGASPMILVGSSRQSKETELRFQREISGVGVAGHVPAIPREGGKARFPKNDQTPVGAFHREKILIQTRPESIAAGNRRLSAEPVRRPVPGLKTIAGSKDRFTAQLQLEKNQSAPLNYLKCTEKNYPGVIPAKSVSKGQSSDAGSAPTVAGAAKEQPAVKTNAGKEIERLAERVYRILEQKMIREKDRRGY
jgi:hypothetical protein